MIHKKTITRELRIMFVIVLFFIAADLAHGQMHDHGLDTFGVVDFPVSAPSQSNTI